MATVSLVETPVPSLYDNAWIAQWTPLTSVNTIGSSYPMPGATIKSVQIEGTFDSATVVLEGSNDGTNWKTLTDPQGNAISKTAAAIEAIEENTRYVRPNSSGGGATQSITVTLLSRRNK